MFYVSNMIALFLCLIAAAATPNAEIGGNAYMIAKVNGVPQIQQNGKSISARMVYVCAKSHMTVDIAKGKHPVTFPFQIIRDVPYVNMFIFVMDAKTGLAGGSMEIGNLYLRDVTTGKIVHRFDLSANDFTPEINWGFRDRTFHGDRQKLPIKISIGSKNDDGEPVIRFTIKDDRNDCLEMRNFGLQLSNIPDLQKGHQYELCMTVDADRDFTTVAPVDSPSGWIIYPGANFTETVALAKAAGVDFVETEIVPWWTEKPESPAVELADIVIESILKINPEAKIIVRISEDVPEWWLKNNPDELAKFDDSSHASYPSIASDKYRHDYGEAIRRTIRHFEQKYSGNMAGYHPCGGNTQEWFYPRVWNNVYCGYDQQTLAGFRNYLQTKYQTEDALRQSWKDRDVSFNTATVPAPSVRRQDNAAFYDPQKYRSVIDFNDYLQISMVGAINYMTRIVREECGKKRLCLIFYGYNYEFLSLAQGAAAAGHYAMRQLLDSSDVDIVAGPISYSERAIGKGETTMGATESVLAAGKLWLNENDCSLHLAFRRGNGAAGASSSVRTEENSLRILRRSLAAASTRNLAIWWMDLYGVGWFNVSGYWNVMKACREMDRDLIAQPEPYIPQTALVFDETGIAFAAPGANGALDIIQSLRNDAFLTGATLGQYLFDDWLAGKVPGQIHYLSGAFALDSKQQSMMRKQLTKTPAVIGWATGYINKDKMEFSLQSMHDATGFEVKSVKPGHIAVTAAGKAFGMVRQGRESGRQVPMFAPVLAPGDVVLAAYQNGDPAVVLRPGAVPLIYCGTPEVPPDLYGCFVRYIKIKTYTDKPAYVYALKDYVAVILPAKGEYGIHADFTGGNVKEVFTDQIYRDGSQITVSGKKGDVFLFQVKPDSKTRWSKVSGPIR